MEELRLCGDHLPLVQLLLVPFKVVQQDSRRGRRDLQITRVATEEQMRLSGYLLKPMLKIPQRQCENYSEVTSRLMTDQGPQYMTSSHHAGDHSYLFSLCQREQIWWCKIYVAEGTRSTAKPPQGQRMRRQHKLRLVDCGRSSEASALKGYFGEF